MMRAKPLKSRCCGAPVVGMVDITVHPRLMRKPDGTVVDGQIVDNLTHVRLSVARSEESDHAEAYCAECGEHVDVREV